MPRAERDLEGIHSWIGAEHSEVASDWYRGLRQAIRGLRELPRRCPVTPENPELRHLLYGSKPHVYRVIYRISEEAKEVVVLHVRHGARQGYEI